MKKITLILLFGLTASFVFSQINITTLEKVDGLWTEKGKSKPYSGEFVDNYPNGDIKGTGNFSKGKLDGLRIQYFSNGNKVSERYYKDALSHGHSKEFYESGTIKQEGDFVKGKENGTWTIYYPNGNKQAIVNFDNGVQNGAYYQYNQKGELVKQFYYKNGQGGYSDEFMELVNKAMQSDAKEAIKLYTKAIKINPTVDQVYFNRGTQYGNTFDFENAILDYNKSIELNPDYKEAYANRGNAKINTYTSKGNIKPTPEQTKSACEDFHKAKELGDNSVDDMIFVYCKEKE